MRNHILTIDVEEYFQVVNLEGVVARASWSRLPSRLEIGLEPLLERLAARGVAATCFVLGCVAERHPRLVRRLHQAGCEIASHGFDHRRLGRMSAEDFDRDLLRTEEAIGAACDVAVRGYRAPHFSLGSSTPWALDVLIERGYRYDSSVFPAYHPEYGVRAAPATPFTFERGGRRLVELPVATVEAAGGRWPIGGGGWLRHTPYALTRAGLRRLERRTESPFTLYLHPWELDPEQPRLVRGWRGWRQYRGLDTMAGKVERLLVDFRFVTAARALAAMNVDALPLGSLAATPVRPESPGIPGRDSRTLRAPAPGA